MSAQDNAFGYSPAIWKCFDAPSHAGVLAKGAGVVITAQAGSAAARSLLSLSARMQGRVVAEARFKAYGCPSAIAVGEWLAEQISGKTVEALRSMDWSAPAIRQALEIAEDRTHCALMGEDALNALLKQM